MDGTLVDSTAVVERIWLQWAEPYGFDRDYLMSVIHGRQGHESMAILLPDRPHEQNITENAALLAAEVADVDGVVEIAGARALLGALRDVPHAIVTSANAPLLAARMEAAGLPVPELLITAESVQNSKPAPDGFLLAAQQLGVDPADCVVFEDSGAGVASAKAAGMRVVGVGAASVDYGPDAVVTDLTSVRVAPDAAGFTITLN